MIAVLQDNAGVIPSQLKDGFAKSITYLGLDQFSNLGGSCERDHLNSPIINHQVSNTGP